MSINEHVGDEGLRDCARGERCAARKTVLASSGGRDVVPAQTYRVYCDADRTRIQDVLNDLPARYAELRARIGDKGRADGPRVSGGGKNPPVPINLGVDALLRQIEEIVLSWDERVRTIARLADLSAPSRADAVPVACTMLARHVDALLGLGAEAMARTMELARHEYLPEDASGWVHPSAEWILYNTDLAGEEAGREALNLHHRCLKVLGRTPMHQDLIVSCWECGEPASLRRHDGSAGLADFVHCSHCGEQYLGSRLHSLMVEEEEAQHRRHDRQWRRSEGRAAVLHGSRDGVGGRA